MIGINFKSAPLEIREKMSFKNTEIPKMLRCIKRLIPDSEVVLLSTCNRTELYAAGPTLAAYKDSLGLIFARGDNFEKYFYKKENLEAVRHLFAVASSLDSMVVGEREILGQVKTAYTCGLEAGTTGNILNPLFQKALKVAKQIQTNTDLCLGHISVSSIAVDFVQKIFTDLPNKTAIIVGSGETSELTLQNLVEKGVKKVLILNRSADRAKLLADKCGGKAILFDLLDDYLPLADIVISSTNAPRCVIHTDAVRKAITARHRRPMLFIDIAVPRDIEEGVGELENVYLYNIDDLREIAAENLTKRRQVLDTAHAIIQENANGFADRFRVQSFGLLIQQMEEAVNKLKEAELARAFSKETLVSLPEPCRREIETLTHRIVNRILATPKIAIRQAARNGQGEEYKKILQHLFGFENSESEETNDHKQTP